MKKIFAGFVTGMLAISTAAPANAIAFGQPRTIYIGSGVYDDGGGTGVGIATAVTCTNVSGVTVEVRVVILGPAGNVEGSTILFNLSHGFTQAVTTHSVASPFFQTSLGTGLVSLGAVNVESTHSDVFCSAMVISASAPNIGTALHLVRVNPHPGTVD